MFSRNLLMLLLVVASSARASDPIPPVCHKVFEAAQSLIANKEKGEIEAKMRGALPSIELVQQHPGTPQAMLLQAMHEMLTEVYGGQTPPADAYATYRAEVCVRNLGGKPTPSNFASVRQALESCAKLGKKEVYACAMHAAGSAEDGT